MSLNCYIQMDPLSALNPVTDTTLIIAQKALKRGHHVIAFSPFNVSLEGKTIKAIGGQLSYLNDTWHQEPLTPVDLTKADVVLVRQEPPFDMNYITNTYILEFLPKKTFVVNPPKILRDFPEKIIPHHLADLMPPTLITSDPTLMADFFSTYDPIIIKPLYLFGGKGVKAIQSPEDLSTYLSAQEDQKTPFILQEFLPDIEVNGDKRIFFFNGDVVCQFSRRPVLGSYLTNMAQGGEAVACTLTNTEKKLCEKVGKFLKKHNIFFAGVDVAQEKLIEVNITCPTGFAAAKNIYGIDLAELFWKILEEKLHVSTHKNRGLSRR